VEVLVVGLWRLLASSEPLPVWFDGGRVFSGITCAACGSVADPLPKRSGKKCLVCREPMVIAATPDGLHWLVRDGDQSTAQEWSAYEAARQAMWFASPHDLRPMRVIARQQLARAARYGLWVEAQIECDDTPCRRALRPRRFTAAQAPVLPLEV
jgi:hypothetical protein